MEIKIQKNRHTRGVFLVLLSAFCWSLNAPLVKSLPLDPFLLTGLRALLAGLILLPFLRPARIRWRSKYTWGMMVFYMVHCTLIVLALRMTSAPIAVAMQFTAPLWLFFWEGKHKESLALRHIWPLIVMLLGMVLFMFSKGTGASMKGNIVAACSSFSFAALSYFSRRTAVESNNPLGLTSASNLLTALVVLPLFVPAFPAEIRAVTAAQWPVLLVLGILQTGGGYAFYFLGLRDVDATTGAMLSPLEMVLGPLWVTVFLHEYPDAIALAAFVLVILGVVGEVLVSGRRTA